VRVCLVNTFHYMRGGDSTYTFDLARLLAAHGDSVIHFAMKHPANLKSEFEQYFVDTVDYRALHASANPFRKIKGLARSLYSFEARRKFATLLKATKPDVVHLQNFRRHLTFSIVPQAADQGIPVVFTAHDYDAICPNSVIFAHGRVCELCKGGRFYRAVFERCKEDALVGSLAIAVEGYLVRLRRYYRLIDRIVTPSAFLRGKLLEHGFPPEQVTVVNNFVAAGAYTPSYASKDYVVYFGRLSPEKGIDTLVRAAKSIPHTRVLIVGDGPSMTELEELRERTGASNVELVGRMERDQLLSLVAESKFVVLPSVWPENFPYALLEAFAVGKAAIGSRIGGIPELIIDGVTGLLVEPGDPSDLGEKMAYLDERPRLGVELGRAARRRVETEFGADAHYEKISGVYREVAESRRHR